MSTDIRKINVNYYIDVKEMRQIMSIDVIYTDENCVVYQKNISMVEPFTVEKLANSLHALAHNLAGTTT